MEIKNQLQRPKAAFVVHLEQFLFGFSYYGVYILILSFFKRALEYDEAAAVALMGAYGAMGPMLNFVGGIISDKFLGVRRSYLIGYILYIAGYICLAIATNFVLSDRVLATSIAITAVAIISVARGVTNMSHEVITTKAHQKNGLENTLDISYSYNYMLNNTGSVTGKSIFNIILGSSVGLIMAYKINFYLATIAIFLAVIIQVFNQKNLADGVNDADLSPMNTKKYLGTLAYLIGLFVFCFFAFRMNLSIISAIVYIMFVLAIVYYIIEMQKTDGRLKVNMIIAMILFFELLVFNVYYNQMFTSLVLYPMNVMKETSIAGITLKAEVSMLFNPLWCVIGSPIIIGLVTFLLKRGVVIHVGYKFAIGLFMTAISYLLFWFSSHLAIVNHAQNISIWWMFWGHSLVAMAELFVLNLGVSTISTLVPKHMTGTVLGIKIMTMSVGSILAAQVAKTITLRPDISYTPTEIFTTYQPFFSNLAIMATIFGCIFIVTTLWMQKLEKKSA